MPSEPPILKLEDVKLIAESDSSDVKLCHTFGILIIEESLKGTTFWTLRDDTTRTGVKIKLCGLLEEYPTVQPGDIIRIHRLAFDQNTRGPQVLAPRNVVVWPSFKFESHPIHKSRSPTINDEDNRLRKHLEVFYWSLITKIGEIRANVHYFNVAGRVDGMDSDPFGNILVKLCDGTGVSCVRVFKDKTEVDTNAHFETASKLSIGQYIVVTNAKLDPTGLLNLSATKKCGKSLRLVEPSSIIGVKMTESLDENIAKLPPPALPKQASQSISPASPSVPTISYNTSCQQPIPVVPLRRSPRFQSTSIGNTDSPSPKNPTQNFPVSPTKSSSDKSIPQFTRIASIERRDKGFFNFYDIAGQVRGPPNETRYYRNWVFQLFDGSCPNFGSFYVDEIVNPQPGCATVLVYSAQKPNDTDKHVESVKKLSEGDLVLVKNIKATWIGDKLKLEMNPNLEHGKSINMIEKDSDFGAFLLERAQNPMVEELTGDIYSTPPGSESMEDNASLNSSSQSHNLSLN